jgi:hypothetical protein
MSSVSAWLATKAAICTALGAATPAPARRLSRCGTPPPTPSEKIQVNRVIAALRAHGVNFRGKTVIPIRFHIIHSGGRGYLPDRRLKAQVEVLNRAYAPSSVAFKIIEAKLHENEAWLLHEQGSDAEIEMKIALGRDTARSLNIYTTEPGGLLGYAAVPWHYADAPALDGVVLHHASLPDATRGSVDRPWPFDLGMTAVHEVGHWTGLYHTFEGGCEAPGDDIADTAYEEIGASSCPQNQPSSCPGETRFNPVDNYMDTSDDACMTHFTPLQYQRIKDMLIYYRSELNPLITRSALLAEIRKSVE